MGTDGDLLGHWLTGGDCADRSGHGNHGVNHGVRFGAGGEGLFDGRGSWIEVPATPALALGSREFTLSARVHTERDLTDLPGDIASSWDPAARRGFHLGILSLAGVTSSQPNHRNLHFGLDAGQPPVLADCGRPGSSVFTASLAVYRGELYAGTFEAGERGRGHVWRYAGGAGWIDCGSPDASNAVTSLCVFGGDLYAGSSHYRAKGSSLEESPNLAPGGRIYRYGGGTEWIDCGLPAGPSTAEVVDAAYMQSFAGWRAAAVDAVHGMAVYGGALYMIPMYHQGLFRYEGGKDWRDCGTPGCRLMSLAVYNGHLYGAGNEGAKRGGVYRYDGASWSRTGEQPGVDQIYSFAVLEGALYAGSWPEATVFRYDGGESWSRCGRLGGELEVMGMAVYNGKLYGGTLPLAELYRYESGSEWTRVGRIDTTPEVRYRRAWSMAVYGGKLYCGTLPSGRVWSLEAGRNVTCDHELEPGWRHVAAVRAREGLRLYVDGRPVAGPVAVPPEFDASSGRPLRIGAGANDFFCGRMRDVRLHGRALSEAEVSRLATG